MEDQLTETAEETEVLEGEERGSSARFWEEEEEEVVDEEKASGIDCLNSAALVI